MPARPVHRTPTGRLHAGMSRRPARLAAPAAAAEEAAARAWASYMQALPHRQAARLAALDAAYRRVAAVVAGYDEACAALRRFPCLSGHVRPALRGGMEAMYRAALARATTLDDVLALMTFEGGYHCYDFEFPAHCRAVFMQGLAFARTPADHARLVEAAGIDGTYWFDDLVALAERRMSAIA